MDPLIYIPIVDSFIQEIHGYQILIIEIICTSQMKPKKTIQQKSLFANKGVKNIKTTIYQFVFTTSQI